MSGLVVVVVVMLVLARIVGERHCDWWWRGRAVVVGG